MRWVSKYTDVATAAVEELRANVSDTWFIDHIFLDYLGNACWQVIDEGTGYLLAVNYYAAEEAIWSLAVILDAMAASNSSPRLLLSRCC